MFLSACNSKKSNSKENNSSLKEVTYLGQKPPSIIPEVFALGNITTSNWEYGGAFSPDSKEFYYLREIIDAEGKKKQEFVVFKNENNKWTKIVISSRKGQPFVSPDGKILHLGSKYMEQTEKGWSTLKKLKYPFKDLPIMRLTVSAKGTYFFDEFKRDFTGDIRYSRLINGKHEEPRKLNKEINTGKSFHPFIAADESYLIFDSTREGGFGDSDIYISFRQKDNSWGNPINLGEKINTEAWEASASVTPDGKYLFFNRINGAKKDGNVDIFWVDSKVIEKLRPKK